MKKTYVLGIYPNGKVVPCIIERNIPTFIEIGDILLTTQGQVTAITPEVGRYGETDEVEKISKLMGVNEELMPIAIGEVSMRYWKDDE